MGRRSCYSSMAATPARSRTLRGIPQMTGSSPRLPKTTFCRRALCTCFSRKMMPSGGLLGTRGCTSRAAYNLARALCKERIYGFPSVTAMVFSHVGAR